MRGRCVSGAVIALALMSGGGSAFAQETDPGRAPTGAVTCPGDLLKEPDGTEFRFRIIRVSTR